MTFLLHWIVGSRSCPRKNLQKFFFDFSEAGLLMLIHHRSIEWDTFIHIFQIIFWEERCRPVYMLLLQSVAFFVFFFQLLRFNWLLMFTIILSNITLLIHPISFLAGLISLMLGLFSESSFYSFIVTKQLLSLLMCSLFTMSLCFKTAYFSWWFFLLFFQQLPCI